MIITTIHTREHDQRKMIQLDINFMKLYNFVVKRQKKAGPGKDTKHGAVRRARVDGNTNSGAQRRLRKERLPCLNSFYCNSERAQRQLERGRSREGRSWLGLGID